MRAWKPLALALALTAAVGVGSAGAALADHHGGGVKIRGVVTQFSLTAPAGGATGGSGSGSGTGSGSGSGAAGGSTPSGAVAHRAPRHRGDEGGPIAAGTPVGSMTVLSPTLGQVSVEILTTTRFEVTGLALAEGMVGAQVQVTALALPAAGGGTPGYDALKVQTENGDRGESQTVRGTVAAVDTSTTPATITIQTEGQNTVTAQLDPNVVVTVGDNQPGTLADVTVGARVVATWQVVNGQMDITAIRVQGAGEGGASGTRHASGTVVSVDTSATPATITFQTENGLVVTASVDPNVVVTLGDHQSGTLADITAGMRVEVAYQVTATGQVDIVAIRVEGEGHGGGAASHHAEGTVVSVDTSATPATITFQTENGLVVTASIDPNATVTVGDNQPGTLADVTAGARVEVTWQVSGGQMDVVTIRVLSPAPGGSGTGSGSGSGTGSGSGSGSGG